MADIRTFGCINSAPSIATSSGIISTRDFPFEPSVKLPIPQQNENSSPRIELSPPFKNYFSSKCETFPRIPDLAHAALFANLQTNRRHPMENNPSWWLVLCTEGTWLRSLKYLLQLRELKSRCVFYGNNLSILWDIGEGKSYRDPVFIKIRLLLEGFNLFH